MKFTQNSPKFVFGTGNCENVLWQYIPEEEFVFNSPHFNKKSAIEWKMSADRESFEYRERHRGSSFRTCRRGQWVMLNDTTHRFDVHDRQPARIFREMVKTRPGVFLEVSAVSLYGRCYACLRERCG